VVASPREARNEHALRVDAVGRLDRAQHLDVAPLAYAETDDEDMPNSLAIDKADARPLMTASSPMI
jgi:hypothetical protein